jgi:hypothetical protein
MSNHTIILLVSILMITIIVFNLFFLLIRRWIHIDVMKKHHELAGYVISVLAVLYSIFLGLTAANAQQSHEKIISKVDKEAYLLADLLMITKSFPEAEGEKIQKTIKSYIYSVIVDEWRLMEYKQESPKTLQKLDEFMKPIYSYNPKSTDSELWFAEFLSILSKFNSSRLERVYSSWDSLGAVSWMVVISGAVLIGISLLFFGAENLLAHIMLNSLFISYLVIMILSIFVFNYPFSGPEKISSRAYEIVYNFYNEDHKHIISPERIEFNE